MEYNILYYLTKMVKSIFGTCSPPHGGYEFSFFTFFGTKHIKPKLIKSIFGCVAKQMHATEPYTVIRLNARAYEQKP